MRPIQELSSQNVSTKFWFRKTRQFSLAIASCLLMFLGMKASSEVRDEKGRLPSEINASFAEDLNRFLTEEAQKSKLKNDVVNELRINGDSLGCIAYLKGYDSCICTVKLFNDNILNRVMEFGLETGNSALKDSVKNFRYTVLNDVLTESYHDFRERKFFEKCGTKNLIEEWRKANTNSEDSKSLQALYKKHFSLFFREKTQIYFQLVGSTDSSLIDSLYLLTNGKSVIDSSTTLKDSKVSKAFIFGHNTFFSEEVSPEITSHLQGLKVGEVSNKIKTTFGWFIAKINRINIVPEVPYSAALPILKRIKALPLEWMQQNSINKGSQERISLTVKFWLLPETKLKIINHVLPDWSDTLGVQSNEIKNFDLAFSHKFGLDKLDDYSSKIIYRNKFGIWFLVFENKTNSNTKSIARMSEKRELSSNTSLDDSLITFASQINSSKFFEYKKSYFRSRPGNCNEDDTSALVDAPHADSSEAISKGFPEWVNRDIVLNKNMVEE